MRSSVIAVAGSLQQPAGELIIGIGQGSELS